ncbi:prim-pol domain-containing protein [Amylocystis lapponica]|nr:prim-pol domain-containing protein [Amylocystis lapponica]
MAEATEVTSPEIMLAFYRRLYPFKVRVYLQGDVYLRYNSFTTAEDLKKQVCTLNPTRFEIGPVYSARPRDKKTVRPGAFSPQLRELVFDIDMTDYDAVRTCCSGADICKRCWAFIAAAVRLLDSAIRDQFGYKHLLWVYSGRRGIHLWISDKEAMELTDEQRRALVGWLTVIQGGKEMHKKVNVRGSSRRLPPSLEAALAPLSAVFSDLILEDQDCFASEKGWEALLHLLPDDSVVKDLRAQWSKGPRSSDEKWEDLKARAKEMKKGSPQFLVLKAAMEDIVLQYTYPRLDAEVSKHRNHLLKAPFCVHPKTGRVCVPVDPDMIENFRPERVPTVTQLLKELDEQAPIAGATAEGTEHHADWERTSLKPYVDMLDRHVMVLMDEVRRSKRGTDMTW